MRFVAEVANRVVLIAAGKILADMQTKEMFQEPALLKSAKIYPPQVTMLAHALECYGVPRNTITVPEMADTIRSKLQQH